MFSNIGGKIKVLAKIIAWFGVICSAIVGAFLICISQSSDILKSIGFGVLFGGSIISWISSWFMYGFGELIEKTTEIAQNTAQSISGGSLTLKIENDKKLEALMSWKENNLISEEEFEYKKRTLLKGE